VWISGKNAVIAILPQPPENQLRTRFSSVLPPKAAKNKHITFAGSILSRAPFLLLFPRDSPVRQSSTTWTK
jgi:hypothetical protein